MKNFRPIFYEECIDGCLGGSMSRAFMADKILENKTVGKLLNVTLRLFVCIIDY